MYEKSLDLYNKAIKTIPTAAQTFSKSSTQYPFGQSPLFLTSGKGDRVKDPDGNASNHCGTSSCGMKGTHC